MSARLSRIALCGGLALALSGCAVLAAIFDPQAQAEQQAQREAEQQALREAEQQAQREQLKTQLEASKLRASAPGASEAEVLNYAQTAVAAVQAGLVLSAEDRAALFDALDARIEAASGEMRDALVVAQGNLLTLEGQPDEAATRYLGHMRAAPSLALFDALARLPASSTSNAALLESCALIRPSVGDEQAVGLVELCLARAGGDTSQLRWPQLESDLAAYEAELARREQAEIARREQAEREAAEAAAEQARTELTREKVLASTYAAGRCRFSKCPEDGWDLSFSSGTLESRCRFSNCLKDGWDTRLPSGGTAETRCRFSNCSEDGWDTRFPDGSTMEVRCRFSNCFEDGWDLNLRGGDADDRGQSRCRFSKCFEDGWDMQMSSGADIECRCRFSKCLEDGSDCG